MTYRTEDGNEATTTNLADEIDQFLSETNQFYVWGEDGAKFMVSANVSFVCVED